MASPRTLSPEERKKAFEAHNKLVGIAKDVMKGKASGFGTLQESLRPHEEILKQHMEDMKKMSGPSQSSGAMQKLEDHKTAFIEYYCAVMGVSPEDAKRRIMEIDQGKDQELPHDASVQQVDNAMKGFMIFMQDAIKQAKPLGDLQNVERLKLFEEVAKRFMDTQKMYAKSRDDSNTRRICAQKTNVLRGFVETLRDLDNTSMNTATQTNPDYVRSRTGWGEAGKLFGRETPEIKLKDDISGALHKWGYGPAPSLPAPGGKGGKK